MAKKSEARFQMPPSPLRRHSEPNALHGSRPAYGYGGLHSAASRPHTIWPPSVYGRGHDRYSVEQGLPIPEPDYDCSYPPPPPPIDEQFGQPSNGARKFSVDSKTELHKEFLWNMKNGINVLQKKPELQRELERRKEERKRREFEEYRLSKKNTFDIKMERQFRKLEMQEQAAAADQQLAVSSGDAAGVTELQRVHNKVRSAASGTQSHDSTASTASSIPGRLRNLF